MENIDIETKTKTKTKTSKEWYDLVPKKYKLTIMDPDGWDRNNYDYSFNEELITKQEFMNRLTSSTVICDVSVFTEKW